MNVFRIRQAFVLLALGLLVLPDLVSAQVTTVRRLRHASGANYTRIVVDVDGPADFKAAFLRPDAAAGVPARFYLDLTSVRMGPEGPRARDIGDPRVRRVRAAQYDRETVRVVAELSSAVVPEVFALADPPRVVIDLSDDPTAPPVVPRVPQRPASPAVVAKAPTPKSSPPRASPPSAGRASQAKGDGAGTVKKTPARATRPTTPAARPHLVVIDPGHGGRDPGARSTHGDYEKEVVMDISRRVARRLQDRMGARVILTRNGDEYVSLAQRKDAANRIDADVFVSIHGNASLNRAANGIETYYLKNSNDRATLRLAKLENGVDSLLGDGDVSGDADLPFILSDMVQGYKEADSILLAQHIQKELVGHVHTRYKTVKDLGVKQGPFYVLDGTYMPSVLVETAFLTNPEEGALIGSAVYRDRLAEGIARGIQRYLEDERVAGIY